MIAPADAGSSTPRYQPLVIVLTAAVGGIVTDRFLPLPLFAWWLMAVAGLAGWAFFVFLRRPQETQSKLVVGNVLLLVGVVAVGGAWHHCRWNLFADNDLGCFARRQDKPACIELRALGRPRRLSPPAPDPMRMMPPSEYSRFEGEALAIRDGAEWRPASGRVLVRIQGKPPEIGPGDRLRCYGELSTIAERHNPNSWDRAAYFRTHRIRCQFDVPSSDGITLVEAGSPWRLGRCLERLRSYCHAMLERHLDPRQADLAAATLLGLREELDRERNEAFLTTGTIHILSISGLHVGILAGGLFWIMRRVALPRGLALSAIALLTLGYMLMVDAQPPVVRATILVLVACVADYFYHDRLGMNSLAAAGLIVLAVNPAELFQVGTQLSFLCVAGLIWFAGAWPHVDPADKTIERLVQQNRSWLAQSASSVYRSVVGLTLAGILLWILTLPLVMARFHILSPAAIFFNALLWIPMTLSLFSGFGVMVFGGVFSALGTLCGWICNANLRILEGSVNMAQSIPWSHFWTPGPADWWLVVFYGGLGLWVAMPQWRPSRRWCAAMALGWIAVGAAAIAWPHDSKRLDATVLSMGHGCAVLLELPSGQNVLYDAGQFGAPSAGVRTVSECLWHRGLRHLDVVVLSHADVDHFNALPGLLEKFHVGEVWVSPTMFDHAGKTVVALRNAVEQHGVPVREVHAGDRMQGGVRCTIEVLHPPQKGVMGSDNAGSVVLMVEHCGRRILLPGDLEPPGMADILAASPRRCEVLLAPHHGSRKSNSPELAAWCRPDWVLFSDDGRWHLPDIDASYRATGAKVLHTSSNGAIHVRIDADGVVVSPFIDAKPNPLPPD